MPVPPGDQPTQLFSFEVKWVDEEGAPRSAKAIGFNSAVKAAVMGNALASEMGHQRETTWPSRASSAVDQPDHSSNPDSKDSP